MVGPLAFTYTTADRVRCNQQRLTLFYGTAVVCELFLWYNRICETEREAQPVDRPERLIPRRVGSST